MNPARRRSFLGGLIFGSASALQAGPSAAFATTDPSLTPASRLEAGDLVVGPAGSVIRVHSAERLASGRYLITYTNPSGGDPASLPLGDPTEAQSGFRRGQRFIVLARGVPISGVTVAAAPDAVLDGGTP